MSKKKEPVNIVGIPFLDILSVTIGGLGVVLVVVLGSFVSAIRDSQTLKILTPETLPRAEVGIDYNVQLSAEGGDPPLTWMYEQSSECSGRSDGRELEFMPGLPLGMRLEQGGLISGEPGFFGQSSSEDHFCFTASVRSNLDGMEIARKNFHLSVHIPRFFVKPQFDAVEIRNTVAGKPYEFELNFTSKYPDPKYFLRGVEIRTDEGERVALPATLSDGLLRWTTQLEGVIVAEIGLSDRFNEEEIIVLKSRSEKPRAPYPDLAIAFETIPNVERTVEFTFELVAKGGWPPYQWSVENLPPDFALHSGSLNPYIKGTTNAQPNSTDVTVRVRDRVGDLVEAKIPFTVVNKRRTIKPISILNKPDFLEDELFLAENRKVQMKFSGGLEPVTWSVKADMPNSIDVKDGSRDTTLSLKPDKLGESTVFVRVEDSDGDFDEKSFTAKVRRKPISLSGPEEIPVEVGQRIVHDFRVRGGVRPYEFSIDPQLDYLELEDGSWRGRLILKPTEERLDRVTVAVSDAAGTKSQFSTTIRSFEGVIVVAQKSAPEARNETGNLEYFQGCVLEQGRTCVLHDATTVKEYSYSLLKPDLADSVKDVSFESLENAPQGMEIVNSEGSWKLVGEPWYRGRYEFNLVLLSKDDKKLVLPMRLDVQGWWSVFFSLF